MSDSETASAACDRRVSQVWQALSENPELKVHQLARGVGLSTSRLQHLIAMHADFTIREFKNQMKIKKLHEARRQLLESNDTLAEIKERAGYNHESNFRRDFKRLFQISPGVWRRKTK